MTQSTATCPLCYSWDRFNTVNGITLARGQWHAFVKECGQECYILTLDQWWALYGDFTRCDAHDMHVEQAICDYHDDDADEAMDPHLDAL